MHPCKTFKIKLIPLIHASPVSISSMVEENFDCVVVNDACKLQWVFISCSCHHLQYLSETNTDISFRLHWLQALYLLAWKCIVSNLTLDSTHMMWHGSFLSFRQYPASHFFFVGNVVLIYFDPACVFLIQHHGASEKHTKLLLHKELFNLIGLELIFNDFFIFTPGSRFILYNYNGNTSQNVMSTPPFVSQVLGGLFLN